MCHCTDRVLRNVRSHGFLAGSQTSVTVPFGEDLEQGYGVLLSSEIWANVVFQTEHVPMGPMVIHCLGTLCNNASLDLFVDSAQAKAERMGVHNWESCQGRF
jgi:hypothetical protein